MAGKLSSPAKGFSALAVDFGTTRCKAAVVDSRGRILGLAAAENSLRKMGEGVYEQDAVEFERSLGECVRSVLKGSKREVDIAVVTGQGSAPVCLDGDGRPAAPVISHFDTRADEERMELREAGVEIGYVPSKIFPNLLWMNRNESRLFQRIEHVLDVREYVGYLLTGEFTHDVRALKRESIEGLSVQVGLEPEAFGKEHDYSRPIGPASGRAERRYGIKRGVPVLQAPGDTVCAAIGSGLGRAGVACDVAGSTEVVAALVPKGMQPRTSLLYQIPHIVEGRTFLFMSPPHGFVFKWFVDAFYGREDRARRYASMDREVASVEASDGNPLFMPLIRTGGYSYHIESQFLRMGVSHTRAHLARSVMEGLAMRVRMALDGIRESGIPLERVRLSGGGAASRVWNQIRTDVFGLPAELIQTRETSSLGAGMVAAAAAGVYRDVFEAEGSMVHVTGTYRPRRAFTGLYDTTFADFAAKMKTLQGSTD